MASTGSKPGEKARKHAQRLLNRELSWLDMNARVLALVADPDLPLLERVKLCAIFSSNFDEFFMIRVAGLMGQVASGLSVRSDDGLTPHEALTAIRRRVLELTADQSRLWSRELQPSLAREGISIVGVEDLDERELEELGKRFDREIYPVLTPLAVGAGQPFPYISGLSISLAVFVRDPETGEERFARVKVPEGLPRYVSVGSRGMLVPLERVIAHFLPWLFPGMEILERTLFRVSRDADFELSDEADDLLEAVEDELRRRRFGDVVRLEVSASTSRSMLERLQQGLGAADDLVYPIHGPLDLADLSELTGLDRPDLKPDSWLPVTRPTFAGAIENGELFSAIRRNNILVQYPYDSFATSFEAFVRTAATDPNVIGLKTTVYRTSDDSALVPALMDAAELGKQSVCLVELKARFDERRNIEWSRSLEQAGVHVVYGFPTLKIHAKITLVVRRESEGGALRRYVHLGTGNYNAGTARAYEDFGFFTCDEEIAADVADLFNYLTGFGRPASFRKILVAPFTLRDALVEEIRAVATAAERGERASIRLKLNQLTDPVLIEELYTASEAGARIEILVRRLCALRPGVPGMSSNIEVRSILGRFLEHSRFFLFDAGARSTAYIGSADLMPRNLDHRIEVTVPIEDLRHREELATIFSALMDDTAGSWRLLENGTWERLRPKKGHRPRSSQLFLMRRARRRNARTRG
jgi:polyphosphate kinase